MKVKAEDILVNWTTKIMEQRMLERMTFHRLIDLCISIFRSMSNA